jgi:hypothetical protein
LLYDFKFDVPKYGLIVGFLAPAARSVHLPPVKYWEVVADKLSAAGWSWGYCEVLITAPTFNSVKWTALGTNHVTWRARFWSRG